MGHYVQKKQTRRRSVSETLAEAEDEHYLDCPDADLVTRSAAVLLDAILIFLVITAMERIARASGGILTSHYPAAQVETGLLMFSFVVKAMSFYIIDVWATFRFGGSFGKILLGLRIVDGKTGSNLSLPRTLFREVIGKIVLGGASAGIGWALAAFRADRLAVQDLISGSTVKKVRQ